MNAQQYKDLYIHIKRFTESFSESEICEYQESSPYPHGLRDDFLPEWFYQKLKEEALSIPNNRWHDQQFVSPRPPTNSNNDVDDIAGICLMRELKDNHTENDMYTNMLLSILHSSMFINFVEKLTRLEPLLPDPHLFGAGFLKNKAPFELAVHLDSTRHTKLHLTRLVNLLIYFGKEDLEGGAIGIYDIKNKKYSKFIENKENRVVFFSQTPHSWHGYPPLQGDPSKERLVFRLYYWSTNNPNNSPNQKAKHLPTGKDEDNSVESSRISGTKVK